MSKFALKIQKYYNEGTWSLARVDKALELGAVTQAEYDEIVGADETI